MSESAKRGPRAPGEGSRGRGRKRRGDWRTKHLRACLLCGRVRRAGLPFPPSVPNSTMHRYVTGFKPLQQRR